MRLACGSIGFRRDLRSIGCAQHVSRLVALVAEPIIARKLSIGMEPQGGHIVTTQQQFRRVSRLEYDASPIIDGAAQLRHSSSRPPRIIFGLNPPRTTVSSTVSFGRMALSMKSRR